MGPYRLLPAANFSLVERRLPRDDRDLGLLHVGLGEEHTRAVQWVPPPLRNSTVARIPGHGIRLLAKSPRTLAAERARPGFAWQPLAGRRWIVHLAMTRRDSREREGEHRPHHEPQGSASQLGLGTA